MADGPVIDFARVASELGLSRIQVENTVALLDEGNTVPFITRYRKERTGDLDEEQIRAVERTVTALRQLAERVSTILRLIEAQGRLTPKLRREIENAETLKRLEDLYLPFRPKRRSRATIARERGLEPFADRIWTQDATLGDPISAAASHIDPQRELGDADDVLQGTADILAERIHEHADAREAARRVARGTGQLVLSATEAGRNDGHAYRNYFDYSQKIVEIPPHRALAINRGEKEGALRIRFEWDDARAWAVVANKIGVSGHRYSEFLERCLSDALSRLIRPSLERELRRELTGRAETHAISVFARNLRNLLLQPPLKGKRLLAIDPGFRTGCKVAILDDCGRCVATDIISVTGSVEKKEAARTKLAALLEEHECRLIAIGNGTACRETEELIAETISAHVPDARYVIVNEAGASIYSTSTVARDEFPDFDATVRGTISIGRRLQDPLSELVKIEPQHIGVGMYQHDIPPKRLRDSLDAVIESCVNYVGVDLNTASASLLAHVSGFNQLIARRVAEHRVRNGPFRNRLQLRDVAGVGVATFTQAAGFLKIARGDEPLDGTWIHPESYEAAQKILERLQTSLEVLISNGPEADRIREGLTQLDPSVVADEVGIGEPTCRDILTALARPGRDPRSDLAGPVFKHGILRIEDLAEGMELTGTVLNVVDFGAFVDVGLKDSGLVHISQLANHYVPSPHDVVAVGDVVTVWVTGVDRERRRISLSMLRPGTNPDQGEKPGGANQPDRRPPKSPRASQPTSKQHEKAESKTSVESKPLAGQKPPAGPTTADDSKPTTAPVGLTASKDAPLKGFDELKRMWDGK